MALKKVVSPDPPRRAALRARLPASMQKLRIIDIYPHGPESYAPTDPDVFYNVETPEDLAQVLDGTRKGNTPV